MCRKTKNETFIVQRKLVLLVGLLAAAFQAWATDVQAEDRKFSDEDITWAIENEMWTDAAVSPNDIDIETDDGIVTFTGSVPNILAKDRSTAIAEATVGVRSVVNRIEVEPGVDRSDKDIYLAVNAALIVDPATDSYDVNIKVKEGAVTLSGKVDSWAEKELCALIAKGVKGVREVENKIDVVYNVDRSDREIEAEIEGRLSNDVLVDDYLIETKVKDGRVKLSGTVGSAQEKRRAWRNAWVAGVRDVDADELQVRWWARNEMRRKSNYAPRDDEDLKKAVKEAFIYDPRVFSFNIDVEVDNGTVTLNGIVDNPKARKAAKRDAQNTVGVWRVRNNLRVRPKTIPANDVLKGSVSTALLNDPYVERYDLDIKVYKGTVYLSGKVNTSFESDRAESVAEGVNGVVSVVNNVDFEHEWTWKPDWEVREDVKEEIQWSPFVDSDQVSVTVENGVVTLTGVVDTWSERRSAEENAYEGGAKDVRNRLRVNYRGYGPHDSGSGYYHSAY